jgi:putative phosphoesterase
MRIGLISDTHVPWVESAIPPQVLEALRGVDLILHAGDIYSHVVLDYLERIAPVLAALGDDDYPTDDKRIQQRHILHLEGLTIWLLHEGPHFPISAEWLPFWLKHKYLPGEDGKERPDIIISGHEHRTFIDHIGDVLHINSGSATYLNYERGPGTLGILDIENGKTDARIIRL